MDSTTTNGHGKQTKTNGTKREVLIKPATETKQPDRVEIYDIEKTTIEATIKCEPDCQLICNNFGWKSIQQMEDNRALTKEQRVEEKKHGKPPVTPEVIEQRFQNARVLDSKGRDCVEARWIKAMLVTAAKHDDVGLAKKELRGVYVQGYLLPIIYVPRPASESNEIITYWGTDKKPGFRKAGDKLPTPGQRRDVVRVGAWNNRQPDIRYRPAYDDWSITFRVTFEPKIISLGTMYHLIRRAGTSVGLCEWRPEGPGGGKGGDFGRFDLVLSEAAE